MIENRHRDHRGHAEDDLHIDPDHIGGLEELERHVTGWPGQQFHHGLEKDAGQDGADQQRAHHYENAPPDFQQVLFRTV